MPITAPSSKWTLVAAVNNEHVLQNTLLRSPDIASCSQILIQRGFSSAGAAYNDALAKTETDVAVLAHQDVYFPDGWKSNLDKVLNQLMLNHPDWGILGVFGITRGVKAEPFGYCYSTGLKRVLGAAFDEPREAQTLDELMLIVRLNSGLRFDEKLPGFHLYGADICMQAHEAGIGSYIIPAFCIHNSNGVRYLGRDYWRSYWYMRRKWWNTLPVITCCSVISRSIMPYMTQRLADARQWVSGGARVGSRSDDVEQLYHSLSCDRETLVMAHSSADANI